MDENKMKTIGLRMSLYMGLTLSLFLTITGVCIGMLRQVIAGNVPPIAMVGSLISGYIISFIISMILGMLIPKFAYTLCVNPEQSHPFVREVPPAT